MTAFRFDTNGMSRSAKLALRIAPAPRLNHFRRNFVLFFIDMVLFGTAFTLIPAVDSAPRTLLFWRSYMQWISGIGIVAFAITTASSTGLFASKIFRTEGRDEALMPSVIATGRSLWKIYGFLTFMAIGLIMFSGLSLWESVNLALAAISSGGFCIHQQGIPYYNSFFLELLLIPVMIAGALPFKLYYLVLENRRLRQTGEFTKHQSSNLKSTLCGCLLNG